MLQGSFPREVIKGADFSQNAIRWTSDVKSGLLLSMFSLKDADNSRKDYANEDVLPVVGTPTWSGNYLTGNITNYIQSLILETDAMTVLFICKRDDTSADGAHSGVVFSCFGGGAQPGVLCYWVDANTLRLQAYQSGAVAKPSLLTPNSPSTKLKRFCARIDATAPILRNDTESIVGTINNFSAARQPGTAPIRILTSYSASFGGLQGLFHLAWWNRALSDVEIAKHWAQVLPTQVRYGMLDVA